MQESARAALTCVRTRAERLGINPDMFKKKRHSHPCARRCNSKRWTECRYYTCNSDGFGFKPEKPARHDVAMTGEITLRGKVLPIGGVKEKLLAAHRFGLKTIIMSKDNEKDLADIPDEVREDLQIHTVEMIDEVLEIALEKTKVAVVPSEEPPIWSSDSPSTEINVAVE